MVARSLHCAPLLFSLRQLQTAKAPPKHPQQSLEFYNNCKKHTRTIQTTTPQLFKKVMRDVVLVTIGCNALAMGIGFAGQPDAMTLTLEWLNVGYALLLSLAKRDL